MKYGIETLPEEVRERINEITMLEPEALTPADISFLRARESYLRPEQKEIYKEVLVDKKETKSTKK